MTPYIYGLHHHPDFWEQPERFDPDRMHPDRKKERPAGAYIPFGAGPRLCIGYSFAMMEMQVVLAMMARQFVLTPAPGAAPRAKALITLRPDPGVTLKLSVRSQ
jgi:cytochrome P450